MNNKYTIGRNDLGKGWIIFVPSGVKVSLVLVGYMEARKNAKRLNKTETTQAAYDNLKGLTEDEFVDLVTAQNCPTGGPYGEAIWHALSGDSRALFNVDVAKRIYIRLGYKPFCGFPLQRS